MAFSSHAFSPTVITFPADPVLAALARHREAWDYLLHASAENAAEAIRMQVLALAVVIVTPCMTMAGGHSLLRHLRKCLAANGVTLALPPHAVDVIALRIADLSLLLEAGEAHDPVSLGEVAAAVARSLSRFGEVAAALVIIIGGIALTGFASLL